ncbi:hypothetical protein A7U60_g5467 [Sanghuangporus baumii]|uniref:Uncharacterized protein n=1 Tax=Sanghuangporus baumii TaxID=108892 RepID=A0A9Q5HWJ7_SANBA|nr:hypothetical protein A7U60_g5467 [Sanghuangporus baumii]
MRSSLWLGLDCAGLETAMDTSLPALSTQYSDAIQDLKDFQTVKVIYVAAFSVMVYDSIVTISDAISCVWERKGAMGKFLCVIDYYLSVWGSLVFFFPLQIVVILRTIALWERNRNVVILLISVAVVTDLCLVVLVALLTRNMHFSPNKAPTARKILGCWVDSIDIDPHAMLPCWAMYCVFNTVIFTLTIVRAVKISKQERPIRSLFPVLVIDGFAYYCVMLAISTTALIMNSVLPIQRRVLVFALVPVLKASFCVLGSRISLHLRQTQTQKTRSSSYLLRDSVRLSSVLASKPPS